MSEFMGMVWGAYDAKEAKGKSAFLPGGASLHCGASGDAHG